jgi:hypothetical protein
MSDDVRAKLGTLQLLDDAIAFRLERLNQPCADCAPGQHCNDHACDLSLIQNYQDRYAAAWRDAFADMDPEAIEQIMRLGEAIPMTAAMLTVAILTRLREVAADRPDSEDEAGS